MHLLSTMYRTEVDRLDRSVRYLYEILVRCSNQSDIADLARQPRFRHLIVQHVSNMLPLHTKSKWLEEGIKYMCVCTRRTKLNKNGENPNTPIQQIYT